MQKVVVCDVQDEDLSVSLPLSVYSFSGEPADFHEDTEAVHGEAH